MDDGICPGETSIQSLFERILGRDTEAEESADGDGRLCVDATDIDAPTNRGDIIAATFCLGLGVLGYFVLVPGAVYVPPRFAGTVNSPAFLPNLLFVVLASLSAVYLVQSVAAWRQSNPQGRSRLSDWGLVAGTALICVGYVTAIYIVGMTVASAACLAALIYFYGERRLWMIGSISLILPTLLWFFFVKIANVFFPVPVIPVLEIFALAASPDGVGGLMTTVLSYSS